MSYLDLAVRAITPIMVVIGWVVVYQLQGLQARRKQLREEAEKARVAVENLQRLAVTFHTGAFSGEKSLEVLVAYNDVSRRCELLPRIVQPKKLLGYFNLPATPKGVNVVVAPALYIALKQAITLEHFDDPQQSPLKPDARQIQQIIDKARAVTSRLDEVMMVGLD